MTLNALEKERYIESGKSEKLGFNGIKNSENVEFRRGKDRYKLDSNQHEQDGEIMNNSSENSKEEMLEESNLSKRNSEISEIINGDLIPDDIEEFDYKQAKRESEVEFLQES